MPVEVRTLRVGKDEVEDVRIEFGFMVHCLQIPTLFFSVFEFILVLKFRLITCSFKYIAVEYQN